MNTMYTATQLVCSETVQIYLHLLHHNLNGLHTEIQIIFGTVYTSVQCTLYMSTDLQLPLVLGAGDGVEPVGLVLELLGS